MRPCLTKCRPSIVVAHNSHPAAVPDRRHGPTMFDLDADSACSPQSVGGHGRLVCDLHRRGNLGPVASAATQLPGRTRCRNAIRRCLRYGADITTCPAIPIIGDPYLHMVARYRVSGEHNSPISTTTDRLATRGESLGNNVHQMTHYGDGSAMAHR